MNVPALIDSLAKPGDCGEIVQYREFAVACQLGDDAENGISADVDCGKTFAVHWAKTVLVCASARAPSASEISAIHASRSASARRVSMAFLSFLSTAAGSAGSKAKLTFIRWKCPR